MRGETGEARSGRASVVGRAATGESEIEKPERAVSSHLEVLRFDVTMNDWRLVGVQVVERVKYREVVTGEVDGPHAAAAE